MIVCLCEGVSSRQIEAAVQRGAESLEEVAKICRAGLGCGSCHEQIMEMVRTLKTVEQHKACDIATPGVMKNV